MRRRTLAFLAALVAGGCTAPQGSPPHASAAPGTAAEAVEPGAWRGGSSPAPVLIGVAIGVGLLVLALSNTSMMPDTSYPN